MIPKNQPKTFAVVQKILPMKLTKYLEHRCTLKNCNWRKRWDTCIVYTYFYQTFFKWKNIYKML